MKTCITCNITKELTDFYKGVNKCKKCKIEYQKRRAEINKDKIKEYQKNYYSDNKEELSKNQKLYKEEHKEEINIQRKQFREDNKERLKVVPEAAASACFVPILFNKIKIDPNSKCLVVVCGGNIDIKKIKPLF